MSQLDLNLQEKDLFLQMASAWLRHLEAVSQQAAKRGHDMAHMNAMHDSRLVTDMIRRVQGYQPEAQIEVLRLTQTKPVFRKDGPIIDAT